jgi:hypothetical protein
VRGVGERKVADLGKRFIEAIASYCRDNRLPLDTATGRRHRDERTR